jgi:hypothetical protein
MSDKLSEKKKWECLANAKTKRAKCTRHDNLEEVSAILMVQLSAKMVQEQIWLLSKRRRRFASVLRYCCIQLFII